MRSTKKPKDYLSRRSPPFIHALTVFNGANNPLAAPKFLHPANSSTWRVSLLVILSRAPTQSLALVSLDAKLRTKFIRVPSLGSSAGSGATTDRDTVCAYDTDVADWVDDVCTGASLLVLVVLTDVSVGASRKVTCRRGTFGAGPTVHTWRTCELTVFQSPCCASLLVLIILAYFGVGASGKVTRRRGADRAGAAVETRRTWELALC